MNTIEAAIKSVQEFEDARKAEGYAESGTVLNRVPLLEFKRNGRQDVLGFTIKCGVTDRRDGKGWVADGTWEAAFEQRRVVFDGASPDEAIAAMLHGVAKLAHSGAMHPDRPERMGSTAIQHAINVLTDRLAETTRLREAAIEEVRQDHDQGFAIELTATPVNKLNQVIAALGTAIAALGRINDF